MTIENDEVVPAPPLTEEPSQAPETATGTDSGSTLRSAASWIWVALGSFLSLLGTTLDLLRRAVTTLLARALDGPFEQRRSDDVE